MIRRFFLAGFMSLTLLCASLAGTAWAGFHERMQPMLLAWPGPMLIPIDEIGLQAALASEATIADNSAVLARTLREISIRTALEDTARMRFELG